MAMVIVASCNCENPDTMGMEAMIPAAMVMDTVAEPTEILTTAATRNATSTIGRGRLPTKLPNKFSDPGVLQDKSQHSAAGDQQDDITAGVQGIRHNVRDLFDAEATGQSQKQHGADR